MAKRKMHPNSMANLLEPFGKKGVGRQAVNNGRKPSKLKKYIKDNNLSSDDIAAIPDIVRPFGMVAVENESVTMAAKLPVELITMGYDAHRAMDALGAMAENGASGDEIIETLGGAMVLCTTCHSSYQFIAEEDLD